jgi:lysophospholipase L1-like esterase
MKFRTELIVDKYTIRFDYSKRYFFIGSCFSDNVGEIMQKLHFKTMVNPFGTVYNPLSISNLIGSIVEPKSIENIYYNQDSNQYFHYDFHSKFNNISKEDLIYDLNSTIDEVASFINEVDVVFITLGTAWVYKLMESGHTVSNCHKMPQSLFTKDILSQEEIEIALTQIIRFLKNVNDQIEIVFTLSPVRHIKDGLIENSLSKAKLLQAIHKVVGVENSAMYFPAYEIMMDDLRDYRFYEKDLIHPNEVAIEYIWNYIKQSFFDQEINHKIDKVNKINSFLDHRPFNKDDESYLNKKAQIEKELKTILES